MEEILAEAEEHADDRAVLLVQLRR